MVKRIFQLRPWAAFMGLISATVVGLLIIIVLYSDSPVPMGNVAAVCVWLGWMTLFFLMFSGLANGKGIPSSSVVIGLYVAAILTHIFLVPAAFELDAAEPTILYRIVAALGWMFGLGGPLIVIVSCTRLLTRLEHEKDIPTHETLGTFLSFFFLPIGIVGLQRRIRSLGAPLG
jgi:hypothetical protein